MPNTEDALATNAKATRNQRHLCRVVGRAHRPRALERPAALPRRRTRRARWQPLHVQVHGEGVLRARRVASVCDRRATPYFLTLTTSY